jgi:putative peptidoglycan lipid II flippase
MSERKAMGRAAAVMMVSVFLSRLLGYARDAIIAWQHGATPDTDAYFAAFTIPDFLNYLLAGGSLSITFIPIFARTLVDGRDEEGHRAFSTVATAMGIAMLFFVVLGELLAERIVPLIAPGFPPEQVATAARLTRIVLPAQFFFYIGGLLMAVQYAHRRFLVPAMAPLAYNGGIIAGGLLLGRAYGMDGFAWGVLLGSFLGNFALQVAGAWRCGLRYSFRLDLSDDSLREFVKLSVPIMIGFSLVVVDEWMLRLFGSFLVAGAITWINNARRLMQVPVGIFGQASGVASYPFLAELAARGQKERVWEALSSTLRWVFLVSTAVGAATWAFSREVTLLVYQRGAFTTADTMRTAEALSAFALAIPLWCGQSIVARGFYAMKDTWTPTIVGTASLVAALPAYYYLRQPLGVYGLALASTLGILLYFLVLYVVLMLRTVGERGVAEAGELARLALAAAAAGAAGRYAALPLLGGVSWETFGGALLRLGAGSAVVLALSLAFAWLLGSPTARSIRRKEDLLHPPGDGTTSP